MKLSEIKNGVLYLWQDNIQPFLFPATIIINGLFFAYNVVKIFLSDNHRLWFVSLAFWYALMALGKLGLTGSEERITLRTRIVLLVAGIATILIAVQIYYLDFQVSMSVPFIVLNSNYALLKYLGRIIKSLVSKVQSQTKAEQCRNKLSNAENLFIISLIFYKLVTVYQWEDNMLKLMAMLFCASLGGSIIFSGIRTKAEK